VLVVSQAIGMAGAAAWVIVSTEAPPGLDDLLPAAGAGLCGAVGLAALYRGMAVGAMGIVAPISAATHSMIASVSACDPVAPSSVTASPW